MVQKFILQGAWVDKALPSHFTEMWEGLSKLPKLRSLYYQTGDGFIPINPADVDQSAARMQFFDKFYFMTQIK